MAAVKGGRLATDDGALEQPEPTDARDVQAKKEEDVQVPRVHFTELEVKGIIGSGVSGDVYKAYWKSQDTHVAVKQLTEEAHKELQALCSLKHPNIIKLYGTTVHQDTSFNKTSHYLLLEFAENGSLYNYLKERCGQPDMEKSLQWAKEIADAMTYLHKHQQVHRDLKSQNVLLSQDWRAKVCDFGCSRSMNNTTRATARKGSYGWMAPEVLLREAYSNKCDVYSFGVVLWELITHTEPYKDLVETRIQMEVAKEDGIRLEIPECCCPELRRLMEDCWQYCPSKRPDFCVILSLLPDEIRVPESVSQTTHETTEFSTEDIVDVAPSASEQLLSEGANALNNIEPLSFGSSSAEGLASESQLPSATEEETNGTDYTDSIRKVVPSNETTASTNIEPEERYELDPTQQLDQKLSELTIDPKSFAFSDQEPSKKDFNLIKWRSADGKGQKYRLRDAVSHQWHPLGETLGFSRGFLRGVSKKKRNDEGECWDAVVNHWLQDGSDPPEDYPVTWGGLVKALEDAGGLANEIKKLLSALENRIQK